MIDSLFGAGLLLVPTGLATMVWLELRQQRQSLHEIHKLVNSQLTGVKADLEIANTRIEGLLHRIEVISMKPTN